MSNALSFGSTRTTRLLRDTPVLCLISRLVPERISKRTGELKPFENRSMLLTGKVLCDMGHSLIVKVRYPSGYRLDRTFFPHEVTVDSPEILNTFRNPLGG